MDSTECWFIDLVCELRYDLDVLVSPEIELGAGSALQPLLDGEHDLAGRVALLDERMCPRRLRQR